MRKCMAATSGLTGDLSDEPLFFLSLRSVVGHPALTSYLSVADNQSLARTRFEMMEVSRMDAEVIEPLAFNPFARS